MILARRSLLAASALGLFSARARAADMPFGEASIGDAAAPVTVVEWFSLTCPHCAAFAKESLPQIREQIINTGKARMVFRDFPLDQVALTAAMVARRLPPQRYVPFIEALFATQDRWAYARNINTTDELAKMAALAGMPRSTFDGVIGDTALRDAILAGQSEAEKTYQVDSTPTFIFNGPGAKNLREAGGQSPEAFAKFVQQATG
jgi:protein-disulfide isomerase